MPGGVASFHSQGSSTRLEPDPGIESEEGGSVLGVDGRGRVTAMSTRWNPGGRGGPNRAGPVTGAGARITSSSVRLGEMCIGDTSGERGLLLPGPHSQIALEKEVFCDCTFHNYLIIN